MASAAWDRLRERLWEVAAAQAGAPAMDLAARRAAMEANAFELRGDATVTVVDAGGAPAEWITVPPAGSASRLLYLHGGGYVLGSPTTHRELAARLARATGCAVLLLDYRLAPEHAFPAAVDDAPAALRWIRDTGPGGAAPAARVYIAGDSAGGGLTLATLLAARDAGDPLPLAAATLSAWTDLTIGGESIASRADVDPIITAADGLREMATQYLGGADPRTPLASPLYSNPAGLPPLLMQVGDAEILLSDTLRFADRARAAGVAVTLDVWPEMVHVWQAFAPLLPEGQRAIDQIAAFLTSHGPA